MKVIFENKFNLTKDVIGMPFLSGDMPVGVIQEVDDYNFTVFLFDDHIGCEMMDSKVTAVYLSHHEQMTYDEFMGLYENY
jgi:hypothetical protein